MNHQYKYRQKYVLYITIASYVATIHRYGDTERQMTITLIKLYQAKCYHLLSWHKLLLINYVHTYVFNTWLLTLEHSLILIGI